MPECRIRRAKRRSRRTRDGDSTSLAVLKPGPEAGKLGGTSEGQKVVQAHVLSMYKLAEEGTYAAAGPFLDGGDIAGLIVVKAATPERAKR